jgi:hypothetical protein
VNNNPEEEVAKNPISIHHTLGFREIGFVYDLILLFFPRRISLKDKF